MAKVQIDLAYRWRTHESYQLNETELFDRVLNRMINIYRGSSNL